ncbi:cadherin-like beta sandwich domain-containing protein [Clostridium chromiireducens]|nr:cadherin-like beta sandwich domain-containing protein [Clostridium chromiireducens]
MNKRIKRIIAITLTISAFSMVEPSKNINILSTKAYARVKGAELEKISLGKGGIDFKSNTTEYTLKLDSDVDELKISATPKEDDAEVEINGTEVSKSDSYKTTIKLDKGENTVTIKVQNGSKKKTYTITVIRGEKEDKEIYLDDLTISEGHIDFSKDKTSYDLNIPSNVDEVDISAVPENDEYDVEIDGLTAYENNDYEKTINLEKGNKKIDVKIQDDDNHEKVYTLNINRQEKGIKNDAPSVTSNSVQTNSATSGQIGSGTNNTAQPNISVSKGWILNNGQWYYLNEKGNKETGWKAINDSWYYLDENGIMKSGWQKINENWYYLDTNGRMKTGWLKNGDGKWYYLYDSGVMAKSTTINGFKLDSTGSWVK